MPQKYLTTHNVYSHMQPLHTLWWMPSDKTFVQTGSAGGGVEPLHTKDPWIKCHHMPVLNQVKSDILGAVWFLWQQLEHSLYVTLSFKSSHLTRTSFACFWCFWFSVISLWFFWWWTQKYTSDLSSICLSMLSQSQLEVTYWKVWGIVQIHCKHCTSKAICRLGESNTINNAGNEV